MVQCYDYDGDFEGNQRPFFCDKHASSLFYRNKVWEGLFISALDKTSFEGVTGPVRFKGNSRRGNIVIKQIVRSKCRSKAEPSLAVKTSSCGWFLHGLKGAFISQLRRTFHRRRSRGGKAIQLSCLVEQ